MTQNGMAENGEMRRIMSDLEKTQMKTQNGMTENEEKMRRKMSDLD